MVASVLKRVPLATGNLLPYSFSDTTNWPIIPFAKLKYSKGKRLFYSKRL